MNVAGYLKAELGLGEGARLLLSALRAADISTSTITYGVTLNRQAVPLPDYPVGPRHDVNLLCINAQELPRFAEVSGPRLLHNRYNIGVWHWELEDLPAEQHRAFDLVHEVWAGSRFTQRAFQRATDKPVHVVAPPVLQPSPERALDRRHFGLPERAHLFLFAFDHLSTLERKNPLGVIEAFSRAFRAGEGPVLIVKSINGDLRPEEREILRSAAARRPDVLLLEQYVSAVERVALMNVCDAYVSLHRSEGFGLTVAEAMSLGKPVITTGYSGTMDFTTPDTTYLIPYVPVPVPSGNTYPPGYLWADPDLDVAAARLREVHDQPTAAAARGQRARTHVLTHHGLQAQADLVQQRLADIRARRFEWHAPEAHMPLPLRAHALAHDARVWARTQPVLRSAVLRARRLKRATPPAAAGPEAPSGDVEVRLQRLEREVRRLAAVQSAMEMELEESRNSA